MATQIAFVKIIQKIDEQNIAKKMQSALPFYEFFGDKIRKIILCPVIVPANLRHHYPEERSYSSKNKTLTLCIHFDYEEFLTLSKKECEEIIEKRMREELSKINEIKGLRKFTFDLNAWHQRLFEAK